MPVSKRLDRFDAAQSDMLRQFRQVLEDHSYEGPIPDEITDLFYVAMVYVRRAYDEGFSDAC